MQERKKKKKEQIKRRKNYWCFWYVASGFEALDSVVNPSFVHQKTNIPFTIRLTTLLTSSGNLYFLSNYDMCIISHRKVLTSRLQWWRVFPIWGTWNVGPVPLLIFLAPLASRGHIFWSIRRISSIYYITIESSWWEGRHGTYICQFEVQYRVQISVYSGKHIIYTKSCLVWWSIMTLGANDTLTSPWTFWCLQSAGVYYFNASVLYTFHVFTHFVNVLTPLTCSLPVTVLLTTLVEGSCVLVPLGFFTFLPN